MRRTGFLLALALLGCSSLSVRVAPAPQLASWFHGGFAGKKIVYWGNSTVSNAYEMFGDLVGQAGEGGLLNGLTYRSDIQGVESDAHGEVTVTLSTTVTYVPGQWVSLRFVGSEQNDEFWAPAVQIQSVRGNAFTYKLATAPQAGYASANGYVTGSILNFGNNGASLAAMLTGDAPYSASLVCEQNPDLLIIRGPLINDVRLGWTDLGLAKKLEKQALALFHQCIPNAAILLTTENSLLADDTGQHWVQPNADVQRYTDIMHDAVMAMKGSYSNLAVVDVMTELYGVKCPVSSPYMLNQLHPNADGQSKEAGLLLGVIGSKEKASPLR